MKKKGQRTFNNENVHRIKMLGLSSVLSITAGHLSSSRKSYWQLDRLQKLRPKWAKGRDPFNQNSNRSDREKRTTSKGGPVFSKLFRLDRTDPLSFGPKFPEILVEWIAPLVSVTKEHKYYFESERIPLYNVQVISLLVHFHMNH